MGYWQGDTWMPDGPYGVGAEIYRASSQSIATGAPFTKVQLNAQTSLPDIPVGQEIEADISTNYRLTVSMAGLYRVTGTAIWAPSGGAAANLWLAAYVNGAAPVAAHAAAPYIASQSTSGTFSVLMSLAADDYVDLRVAQSTGASQNVTIARLNLDLVR